MRANVTKGAVGAVGYTFVSMKAKAVQNALQSRLGSWLVHRGIVRGMAVRGRENDSEIQQLGSAIDDRVGVSFI